MKKLNNKGMAAGLMLLAMFGGFMAVSVPIGEYGIHKGWFQRHQPTPDSKENPAPIQKNLGGEA